MFIFHLPVNDFKLTTLVLFKLQMNLRVGKNINLNYSCSDVVWNPEVESLLATAATNGAVVIWDLNKGSKCKQEFVLADHKRTVNRVVFQDGNTLLSGSQVGVLVFEKFMQLQFSFHIDHD